MEKLDFGDLSKFLVSSGVALIGAGVAVVWLAYREPFDLLVTSDVLDKVTPLAKEVLLKRQAASANVIAAAPWFGGGLALAGAAMIGAGIRRWLPQQRALDLQNKLAGEKAARELVAMTTGDVLAKASAEAAESESAIVASAVADGPSLPLSNQAPLVTSSDVDEFNRRVTRYLQTEETVLSYLRSVAGDDYEVLPHRRIGRYTYDAVLRSKRRELPDIVVEIKDLQARASLRYVKQAQAMAARSAAIFSVGRGSEAVPVVLAVVDDDRVGQLLSDEWFRALYAGGAKGLVRFIPRGRLADLDRSDFSRIVDPSIQVDVLRPTSGSLDS